MTSQIDLSKYVGKKVRVTLKSGIVDEGIVKSTVNYDYPFSINLNYYSNKGEWKNSEHKKYDIFTIEELQMNNYQELENKVKELQAEIDRLKAQDQKKVQTFREDIKKVLQTFHGTVPYNTLYKDYLYKDYADKICEIVESYIPDLAYIDYDTTYNTAIHKVKKNLGLNK